MGANFQTFPIFKEYFGLVIGQIEFRKSMTPPNFCVKSSSQGRDVDEFLLQINRSQIITRCTKQSCQWAE